MRPEGVLRFLDTLDGMADAMRLVYAGHGGQRLRLALFALVLCLSPRNLPLEFLTSRPY